MFNKVTLCKIMKEILRLIQFLVPSPNVKVVVFELIFADIFFLLRMRVVEIHTRTFVHYIDEGSDKPVRSFYSYSDSGIELSLLQRNDRRRIT